jgi:hypothetical protein
MDKYTVEVAIRAAETFGRIYESATEQVNKNNASHPSVALLHALNELIDKVISRNPFDRRRLMGPLSRVYWVSRGRLRIFFIASPKPKTVVIVRISTRPRSTSSDRHAEAIIQQMILARKIVVALPSGKFVH